MSLLPSFALDVFFSIFFLCYKLLPCIRLALHFVEMDVKDVSPSQFGS